MADNEISTMGGRVRARREALGLSKTELARRVTAEGFDCAIQNIAQIESGQVSRITYLAELSRALKAEASWLQNGIEPAKTPENMDELEWRAGVRALCKLFGVKRLEVFGSAARGVDFDEATSDFDFIVEFKSGREKPWMGEFAEFKEALEVVFGRNVDLISRAALDQMRNRYRREAIEKDRTLLYAA
ncbi:MAG: nucleotidyltransferase domain-containing protein [Parvularculaceae bacterium]|nr:nucleotidyltransferase domain-containing protein [Parvularculaceae bacterium]